MTNNQPSEIVEVDADTQTVCCNGGGGPLGHPAVYYTFTPGQAEVVCQYCSRTFRKKDQASDGTAAA